MNDKVVDPLSKVLNTTSNKTPDIENQLSFIQEAALFMNDGGIFMWIILATWTLGVCIALERYKKLFSYDVDGDTVMNNIKKYVLLNEVPNAIKTCSDSTGLLPQVLKSGLKRANQSKEQIIDAVESSILEVAPKIEKRMGYLALVANISTLVGLLGTIQGLIQSFGAVASVDPSSKSKMLALGISKAMNTTAAGLISAISILVIYQILTSKSEKILSEIDEFSSKLVDLLGTKKQKTYNHKNNSQIVEEKNIA